MTDYVQLYLKRNRGWPWPEDSWGLTPMFGEDGWCHSCGVPTRPQSGSIVLQRKGIKVEGAWVPNWRFDAICLESSLSDEAASRFDLRLLDVAWHGVPPGEAKQIIVPSLGDAWFDPDELRAKAIERHGAPGASCPVCGTWRWLPLPFDKLPPPRNMPIADLDIIASPEWFGDGWKAFRQVLVRRELADLIAAASPKDFEVQEVV